jgi:hypothetical protein
MDSRNTDTVSIKDRLFCGSGGVTKGTVYSMHSFKYFLVFLWSKTTLNTLKSQLNIPGHENTMSAGRQLQWPLAL